jgi:NIMA (never in mitosis gene a)-related kinase
MNHTQTGTPYYASPEVWRDEEYGTPSDIWSLGCVVYEMLALKPPFVAKDMNQLYRRICRGQYPRIPQHFSNDIW